jgi:hypothetical protein
MDSITQELERDLYLMNKKEKKISKLFSGKEKIMKAIEKNFSKYNCKIQPLKIKYGRENVLEVVVKNDKFGHHDFTRNNIQTLGNDLSHILHEGGVDGLLTTAMKFNNYYRNGRNTNIGDDIDIFDANDYEYHETEKARLGGQNTFGEFRFYLMRTGTKIGKDSDNNDCLYNCLLKILLDNLIFKTPIKFKEFLKIERNEGVNIDRIKDVEAKLNISINVSGDHIYTSVLKTNKQINLKLINNHYTIDHSLSRKAIGVSYKERNILLYDKMADIGYDGVSIIQMSKRLLQDIYAFRCAYIVVPRTEFEIPIEVEFENLTATNKALKQATKGFINLGETGTIKKTSLYLFERLSAHIPNPEHISQIEMTWIENASLGAIIFSEDYEGEAWKYDVKSMYPSIMCSKLLVPMKKGEFRKFTLDEFNNLKFYPNGIYRAVVKASTDIKTNRLFRFNKLNYYTQISLSHAITLGLTIELIIDDQPNSLLYSRDKCLRCDEIFSKFVAYMFDLKNKKVPMSKLILNMLWGALTESDLKKVIIDNSKDDEFDIKDNMTIVQIKPSFLKDITFVKYANNDSYYKSNFARLKPFFLSKARSNICDIMLPYKDTVVKCHTDSLTVSKYPTDIKTGSKLGELAFEGYCDYIVVRNNAKEKDAEGNNAVFKI